MDQLLNNGACQNAEDQIIPAEVGAAVAAFAEQEDKQTVESGGCNLQLSAQQSQHPALLLAQEMTTYTVDIDLICPDPTQPRKDFDDAKLAPLRESIEAIGQQVPVVIRPPTENQWILVDGECRVRALRELGKSQVLCHVRENLTELQRLQIQLAHNKIRNDLQPVELALCVKRFQTLRGEEGRPCTDKEAALQLNLDKTRVSRALTVLNQLCPEYHHQIGTGPGKIPPSTAYQLARIADPEQQRQLAEEVLHDHLSHTQIVKQVREILGSKPRNGANKPLEDEQFSALENRQFTAKNGLAIVVVRLADQGEPPPDNEEIVTALTEIIQRLQNEEPANENRQPMAQRQTEAVLV